MTAREDQLEIKCWHCNELIGSQSYGVGPSGPLHWACYDKLWPNRILLVPAPEDQPRPTKTILETPAGHNDSAFRNMYLKAEAQGEAPQVVKVGPSCSNCGTPMIPAYRCTTCGKTTGCTVGAHPSQDAPPVHEPFMAASAEYLREWSGRYVRYADDAKLDWSGGEAQYHLANFAGRMQAGARSDCKGIRTRRKQL